MSVFSLSQNAKSQRAELQVQQWLSINSTVDNSTAGEKQIQCIKGGRGGEIHQDNFKSAHSYFPSLLWNNFSSGQIQSKPT